MARLMPGAAHHRAQSIVSITSLDVSPHSMDDYHISSVLCMAAIRAGQ